MAVETLDRSSTLPSRFHRYRVRTGMFAWILHRLSGVALVGYLIIHVWGLKALSNREGFNELIASYHAPIFKIGEFFLLAAVGYHALNGLRIVLIDFLGWSPNHKKLFWTLGFVFIVILVVGGYPSLYAVFEHFSS